MKQKTTFWQVTCQLYILLMLLLFVARPLAPQHLYRLYATAGYLLTAGMLLAFLLFGRSSRWPELRLLTAYLWWVLISRLLNGAAILYADGGDVIAILREDLEPTLLLDLLVCCLLLACAAQLGAGARRKTLLFAAGVCTVFYLLTDLAALFVLLTDTRISFPPENVFVARGVESVTLFSNNHNISMVWLYIGIGLTAWLCASTEKKALRWCCGAAIILSCLLIAHSSAKTVKLVLCMSGALLAAILVQKAMAGRKRGFTILTVSAAVIVGLGLSYGLSALLSGGLDRLAARTAPAFSAYYSDHETLVSSPYLRLTSEVVVEAATPVEEEIPPLQQALAEEAAGRAPVVKDRLYLIRTLTERTILWRAALDSTESRPQVLWMGSTREKLMDLPNQYARGRYGIGRNHEHLHNCFVQTLMLTGIPGLLLVVAFCAVLLWRVLRLLFSAAPIQTKLLLIPLIGLFIQGQLEAGLFTAIDLRAVVFFTLSGMVLREYRTAFPKRSASHGDKKELPHAQQ